MCSEKVLAFVNTFSLGTATGGLCRWAQGRWHTHPSSNHFMFSPKPGRSIIWAHSSPWNRRNSEAKRSTNLSITFPRRCFFYQRESSVSLHCLLCINVFVILEELLVLAQKRMQNHTVSNTRKKKQQERNVRDILLKYKPTVCVQHEKLYLTTNPKITQET